MTEINLLPPLEEPLDAEALSLLRPVFGQIMQINTRLTGLQDQLQATQTQALGLNGELLGMFKLLLRQRGLDPAAYVLNYNKETGELSAIPAPSVAS